MDMLLVLRVPLSSTERHSHWKEYLLGWLFLNTYTWLLAMRSCAISTFSLPFTTKYPPCSGNHSSIFSADGVVISIVT